MLKAPPVNPRDYIENSWDLSAAYDTINTDLNSQLENLELPEPNSMLESKN